MEGLFILSLCLLGMSALPAQPAEKGITEQGGGQLGVTIAPERSATCEVDYVSIALGSDASTRTVVKSGTVCSSHIRIGGGGISSMAIRKQASHGIVGLSGTYYWAYESTPGYVGRDEYIIGVVGETMGAHNTRGSTAIDAEVEVVP